MFDWLKRTAPEPPVLDFAYLERLESHIERAVVRELMADGMIDLIDKLDRLKSHATDGNLDDVAAIAHDIAGVSGHLGLTALSHAAVALNRSARAGDEQTTTALAAPLIEQSGPALEALRRYLNTHFNVQTEGLFRKS